MMVLGKFCMKIQGEEFYEEKFSCGWHEKEKEKLVKLS
jgi:hypothetical protein